MTMPIMTQTLPTIIGMGVVSRTTETMFGRRGKGRRRSTAKSTIPRKKFGGKMYTAANWHTTKAVAVKDAEHFRRAGHSARVVRTYSERLKRWGYTVYVR